MREYHTGAYSTGHTHPYGRILEFRMTMTYPAYSSLALAVIPDPDYADMSICVLPAHAIRRGYLF